MTLNNYAFFMIGAGYNPAQIAQLKSEEFSTTVICIENIEMACEEAKKLVDQDIQLIELCGAFKGDMVDAVINAVDGKIAVGNMGMRDEERSKFKNLMKS